MLLSLHSLVDLEPHCGSHRVNSSTPDPSSSQPCTLRLPLQPKPRTQDPSTLTSAAQTQDPGPLNPHLSRPCPPLQLELPASPSCVDIFTDLAIPYTLDGDMPSPQLSTKFVITPVTKLAQSLTTYTANKQLYAAFVPATYLPLLDSSLNADALSLMMTGTTKDLGARLFLTGVQVGGRVCVMHAIVRSGVSLFCVHAMCVVHAGTPEPMCPESCTSLPHTHTHSAQTPDPAPPTHTYTHCAQTPDSASPPPHTHPACRCHSHTHRM